MPIGIVKWFNNAKGFGFIQTDNTSEDIFAHYSAIEMEGFRTLKAGQSVEFDIVEAEKGLHAANIRAADTIATHDNDSAIRTNQPEAPPEMLAEHA